MFITKARKYENTKIRKNKVIIKFDGLVKSLQGRHSREGGSPEPVDFPGFPLSRE
jgi:hypothetical protein